MGITTTIYGTAHEEAGDLNCLCLIGRGLGQAGGGDGKKERTTGRCGEMPRGRVN